MRLLSDANLKPGDHAAVLEAAATLRAQLPVDRVIVFGSKARGDDGPDSDIDLLILTSRGLTDAEERRVVPLLLPIQLRRGVLLSPIVVSTQEWNEGVYQVMPIRVEVDRDGVAA